MDLGDDHRFDGTLCPDMELTLARPNPDVVTAVTRSADLLREGRGLLLDLVDQRRGPRRVNAVTARTGRVDVDALLIRPDGLVARALTTGRTSTPPRWCVR